MAGLLGRLARLCRRRAVAGLLGGLARLSSGRAVAGLLADLARLPSGRNGAGLLGDPARLSSSSNVAELLRGRLDRLSRRRGFDDLSRAAGVSHDDFIGQLSATRDPGISALALKRAVARGGGLGRLLDIQVGDGPLAVEVSNPGLGNAVEEGQYGQDVVTHCDVE